jgi:hypothetical protein
MKVGLLLIGAMLPFFGSCIQSGGAMLGNHGNDDGTLFTGLSEDGKVVFKPGGPGQIRRDALRADIPGGNARYGFTSTALIFPTVGCWEVTGQVGAQA